MGIRFKNRDFFVCGMLNGIDFAFHEVKGHKILRASFRSFSRKLLREIIEESFGEKLIDCYFEMLMLNNAVIYADSGYHGTNSVLPAPSNGVPAYMQTLAVVPPSRNQGLGEALILASLEDYKKLSWRSKPKRKEASNLYKDLVDAELAETGDPFAGKDGVIYNPYWINYSLQEKGKSLNYMHRQPEYLR